MTLNRAKINAWWVFFFCFLFSFGLGCADDAEKKARHQERAKQYIEGEEFKKAVIELKNVIQLDPQDDAAYYELGEIYLKLGQGDEAFQSFSRAVSINPENLDAQLKVGQISLLINRTQEARDKAEFVLEKLPDSIEGLSLFAGVQLGGPREMPGPRWRGRTTRELLA